MSCLPFYRSASVEITRVRARNWRRRQPSPRERSVLSSLTDALFFSFSLCTHYCLSPSLLSLFHSFSLSLLPFLLSLPVASVYPCWHSFRTTCFALGIAKSGGGTAVFVKPGQKIDSKVLHSVFLSAFPSCFSDFFFSQQLFLFSFLFLLSSFCLCLSVRLCLTVPFFPSGGCAIEVVAAASLHTGTYESVAVIQAPQYPSSVFSGAMSIVYTLPAPGSIGVALCAVGFL